ncbi:MAG: bifunctional [glutamate--ammonia ligase]-adenylyl-L-tyrosine phosphorylase/[glutamate--ammonia-ligase] adenylyltransferase [Proteobacteria bacterium]|nr:bifunctional [glutamate--ammonia ligase]-adenylyl-L-tyrosine phosphorylase/[glutamate--ammonia-ligase] adenylyltransferase [Pseudomonadota bacterium]
MGGTVEKQIADAVAELPGALRPSVDLWFQRLLEQCDRDKLRTEFLLPVARIVACSEFAGRTLLREWDWFTDNVQLFGMPTDAAELDDFAAGVAASGASPEDVKSQLRRFRNCFMLRVLWREVLGLATVEESLQQLSALADKLLDGTTRYSQRQLSARYGTVRNAAGEIVPLVILGMGKLGGRELNFSSDIDLIFCYAEDGESDGARRVSAQEYFTRLSRNIIALIDDVTEDGFAFRVDTRLRPFGDSGPPVVSFSALESYLLKHGRDWERYAYVKARVVGVQPEPRYLHELNTNLIQPFVYRRYLDYGVFESLREMHAMIAADVLRRELEDNVKLGPGGIREAEFIVQAMQLVRGGSEIALQSCELQSVLPKLVSDRGLTAQGAEQIGAAYRFLRRLENFIQAIRDEQTHDLPSDPVDRARLCLAMGYASWDLLISDLDAHRDCISTQFAAVAFRGQSDDSPLQQQLRAAWTAGADEQQWCDLLHGLIDDGVPEIAAKLTAFANSAATKKIDAVAQARLQRFIPDLIILIAQTSRPLIALSRTIAVVERILRRSAYIALLNENRTAFSRLVDLCERSFYIADQIARYPVLLDELLDPRGFSDQVTKADLAAELRERLVGDAESGSEEQMIALAQHQRATMFRIAVADFNGSLPIMKVSDGLTWLAEAVLDEALRVAWQDLTRQHGVPCYVIDGKTHEAGFGIIGYGKLGGLELSYGSDLDIVFLHDSCGNQQETDGAKAIDNGVFFGRLVRRLVHFLTTQTESGELYKVDTRLRPDGHSGLLVTTTEAFERYQEEHAWTWEHQALLRARAVAGSDVVAKEFERIRSETLTDRVRRDKLRDDVISMRKRMRKELDKSNVDVFDLKHGRGGIGDLEFLVQYLVLNQASSHPDVIRFSDNIRQLDALIAEGCLQKTIGERLQDAYRNYRLCQHHLVLDGQVALTGAVDFQEQRDFVVSVWDEWLG